MLIDGMETDTLPASDRGLQYGDGLFETLAVIKGQVQLWSAHMARLASGCRRLGIPVPDMELLLREAGRLSEGVDRGVLKLMVTRGSGGRGYRPPQEAMPRRILSLHPWPDYPPERADEGVWIRSCDTRLAIQPALAGMKHLNRLEQVLARREWNTPEIVEGVMCDPAGHVIEATMSNLFFVRDGRVMTPALNNCGVEGVMRAQVMEICASLAIPLVEQAIDLNTARASDEVFLTNSLIGVWPVRRWDDTKYQVPGRTTAKIINTLKELMAV